MRLSLQLLLVACASLPVVISTDLIISPISGKTGPEVAFVFGQGASIRTSQYQPLAVALQQAVTFPLWFAVPACTGDICAIPGTLKSGVARVLQSMKTSGLNSNAKVFYGGHSLGGAMMPNVVNETSARDSGAGMILMGSFLTRTFKTGLSKEGRPQVEFPLPTLTIGGELDGLCRLTRITEALYSQITFSEFPAKATHLLPVTVIEGMSHIQFASGAAPAFVKHYDLQPEISEKLAQQLVAKDVAAFMNAVLSGSNDDWSMVEQRVQESTEFVQPIIDAFVMEGYSGFLPPCYCETKDEYGGMEYGTCTGDATCQGGVPWTEQVAQPYMAGVTLQQNLTITVRDSIHRVTEEKPSCHLPHIHKSQYSANTNPNANPGNGQFDVLCTEDQLRSPEGCALDVTSVTQPFYGNLPNAATSLAELLGKFPVHESSALKSLLALDTGLGPVAATELRGKLKSRQAIWQAAGVANVSFIETDTSISKGGKHDICSEINQKAIDWALAKLPAKTLARYNKIGQTLMVGPDKTTCIAGPCWINAKLSWTMDNTNGTATVQGTTFPTKNSNSFPCGENKGLPCDAGFHYCKLLSPARAMEWMFIDSLKLRDHI